MHEESRVHKVEVTEQGTVYRADYYIENGIIVANLNGKTIRVPIGLTDPHKTVRALLAAHVQRGARLSNQRDEWTSEEVDVSPRGRGRPRVGNPFE